MAERPIFITFCTADRWTLPEIVRPLVMKHCLHDHNTKYRMHGLMVMPDHVHMILSLHRDHRGVPYGFAEILNGIKGASAHSIDKALNRKGHVWQDESYDHVLRTSERLREAVEYVCYNPIRKGLVTKIEDWPWLWREWVEGSGPVAPPPSGVP
jgi:REP element-mobilizing transposase RayT